MFTLWLRRLLDWERHRLAREVLEAATRRRAPGGLLLRIQACRQLVGKMPETLDGLVSPTYDLDHLPIDPYTGEPFRYFPEGLPIAMVPLEQRNWFEPATTIKPKTPLVSRRRPAGAP